MNVAFVRILLIVVETLVSLLLIGVVLLQRARNEGLGLAFGSGMGETLFGSRAGNVLTRITVWLSVIFVANTLVLAVLYSGGTQGGPSPLMTETTPAPVPVEAVPGGLPLQPEGADLTVPSGAVAPAPETPAAPPTPEPAAPAPQEPPPPTPAPPAE